MIVVYLVTVPPDNVFEDELLVLINDIYFNLSVKSSFIKSSILVILLKLNILIILLELL